MSRGSRANNSLLRRRKPFLFQLPVVSFWRRAASLLTVCKTGPRRPRFHFCLAHGCARACDENIVVADMARGKCCLRDQFRAGVRHEASERRSLDHSIGVSLHAPSSLRPLKALCSQLDLIFSREAGAKKGLRRQATFFKASTR